MTNKPLVSVGMITYQHAPYIREAIDSVLNQQSDFPFELVIGEDESTDGTRKICKEYAEKYPDKIKLILRDRSDPARKKYDKLFMHNFVETLKACQGQYIALLEGDDYWIDPLKLQKQIDIFRKYPDTIICGGHAKTWHEDSQKFTSITPSEEKQISCLTPYDFFHSGVWIKLCTRMTHRDLILSVPPDYLGDYCQIHYLLTKNKGKIRCLKEVVAIYRLHDGGVYGGASSRTLYKFDFESERKIARLYTDDRRLAIQQRALRNLGKLKSLGGLKTIEWIKYNIYFIYLKIVLMISNKHTKKAA